MTEKRFTYRYNSDEDGSEFEIIDLDKDEYYPMIETIETVVIALVDCLNNLHDENEQLKQFKEDVFNKINMHLRMLPTARDNEFNEDDGDPSLYVGAIYMLETLKKELSE